MFLFAEIVVIANLYLAVRAHKAQPSRVTLQIIAIMALGVVIYSLLIGLVLIKEKNVWDRYDNITAVLVLIGISATLMVARKKNLTATDPIVKGWLILWTRTPANILMACKILIVGGAGVSGVMVVIFHILTVSRILQIWFSIKEAGWDRNRKGMALNEIGNETSWILVTIAWLTV
ncbi:MAG: hypothetical protein Q8P76_00900 [bacterium]|nr:hypothetical protein [bacterium]